MRKLLFITAVFAFVGFSNAQQKVTTNQATEVTNNLDRMEVDLNLTSAQKASILGIYEKYTAEKVAIRETGTARDFKALNEKRQGEIDAVLTAEQLNKRTELESKREKEKMNSSQLNAIK